MRDCTLYNIVLGGNGALRDGALRDGALCNIVLEGNGALLDCAFCDIVLGRNGALWECTWCHGSKKGAMALEVKCVCVCMNWV